MPNNPPTRPCVDCGRECYGTRCKPCENVNRRQPALPRILARVLLLENGCWHWTGALQEWGYGKIGVEGRCLRVHRVTYEELIGPIPEGMELDHLCRNRACCNPSHLEPVTRSQNIRRGQSLAAKRASQTHCKRGHAFSPENTHLDRKRRRICLTCRSAYNRTYVRPSKRKEAA